MDRVLQEVSLHYQQKYVERERVRRATQYAIWRATVVYGTVCRALDQIMGDAR